MSDEEQATIVERIAGTNRLLANEVDGVIDQLRAQLKARETSTDWQLGGIAMARSMQATLKLIRDGKWTLDQADEWVEGLLK